MSYKNVSTYTTVSTGNDSSLMFLEARVKSGNPAALQMFRKVMVAETIFMPIVDIVEQFDMMQRRRTK